MTEKYDVVKDVMDANPNRNFEKAWRRILKLGEEQGETCEAYLYVTSETNSKNKKHVDVREEACDAAITALCIALTPLPLDDTQSTYETPEEAYEQTVEWLQKKINRFREKQKNRGTACMKEKRPKTKTAA